MTSTSPASREGNSFRRYSPAPRIWKCRRCGSAGDRTAKPNPRGSSVVEDEEKVRVLLNDAFRTEGHEVTEATTGAEALKRLDAGEFDLMICDLGLPELSGLHVARWVKEFRPDLPVIIATGFAEMIADTKTMTRPASMTLISKPYAAIRRPHCGPIRFLRPTRQ